MMYIPCVGPPSVCSGVHFNAVPCMPFRPEEVQGLPCERTLGPAISIEGRRLEGRLSTSTERRPRSREPSSPPRAFWCRPPRLPRRVFVEFALLPGLRGCSVPNSVQSDAQLPACGLVGMLMPCTGSRLSACQHMVTLYSEASNDAPHNASHLERTGKKPG